MIRLEIADIGSAIANNIVWVSALVSLLVAILIIWWESKPGQRPDHPLRYFNYVSGSYVEEHSIEVTLGRMPYLNRVLFRWITLVPLANPNVSATVELEEGPSVTPLVLGSHWFEDSRNKSPTVYLLRAGCPPKKRTFRVRVRTYQERARGQIRDLVKSEVVTSLNGGTTVVTIKLNNTSPCPIKDFEVVYKLPVFRALNLNGVYKLNLHRQTLVVSQDDIAIRDELTLRMLPARMPPTYTQPSLIASLTLDPGLTEVNFQYA